jgi:dimethylamine/trimethylamine dehydrogenase
MTQDARFDVLVVGAGPAGLEAARILGERGYQVTVAEATENLGGRVTRETGAFSSLATWARVRDYRTYQLSRMANVSIFPASPLTAADVLEFGATRVAIATGARWRRDGVGRESFRPIPGCDAAHVLTPDDIMDGKLPNGPVVVYDDDHYYMGGVVAERLADAGREVVLVTPEDKVASWAGHTLEQGFIQAGLLNKGVRLVTGQGIAAIGEGEVELACSYTGKTSRLDAASVVLVTARLPVDELFHALMAEPEKLKDAGVVDVTRIGDCFGPATIANAVHAGHRYGRELTWSWHDETPFLREAPSAHSI